MSLLLLAGGKKSLIAKAYYRWYLSGTIVPNRPFELYPLLRTNAPELIAPYVDEVEFGKHFCAGYKVPYPGGSKWDFSGASNEKELGRRISPFMLRRDGFGDIWKDIPDVIENTYYIKADPRAFIDLPPRKPSAWDRYYRDDDWDEEPAQAPMRRAVGLAKIPAVYEYLKDRVRESTNKIIVFAYSRDVILTLTDDDHFGVKSRRICGGMSQAAQLAATRDFSEARRRADSCRSNQERRRRN